MIRGVNRFTIEISRTGSPYFERAICFVRPEFTGCDRVDLHRAAKQMINGIDAGVEVSSEPDVKQAPPKALPVPSSGPLCAAKWLPYAISAVGGAAAGLIMGLLG